MNVWLVMLGMDTPHENHVLAVYGDFEAAQRNAHQRSVPTGWQCYVSGPWVVEATPPTGGP